MVVTNSSTGSFSITAPANPAYGATFGLLDSTDSWSTSPVTLLKNGKTFNGADDDLLLDGGKQATLIWDGSTWRFVYTGTPGEGTGISEVVWGPIGGTLSEQTDLQNALDSKVASPVATGSIANDAVTFAKIQNATASSVLIGRGQSAGAGDFQQITLGSNLSMIGTQLTASGSVAPSADASTVTYTPLWSGAIALSLKDALDNGVRLGKYFGLNGNGVFNNTTVLDTALTAIEAEGGGDLYVDVGSYLISNVTLRNGVRIVGSIGPGGASSELSTRFDAIAGTTGTLFAGPASGSGFGLIGLLIGGGSALASPLIGANFTAGTGRISACYFSNFSSHCIKFSGGFQNVTNTHCNNGFYTAYDSTPTLPTVKSGVIHLEGGSDHTVDNCGIASRATGKVSSAGAFVCAVVVKSNGCWITGGDLHHCDVGLHIGTGAFRTQVHGIRVDSPAGNGIEVPSSDADMTLCTGAMVQRVGGAIIASPAYDSTNLYDGLNIQDPSGHIFVGCFFHGRLDGGVTPQMRYGINDTSSNGTNSYIGCHHANAVTAGINATSARTQVVSMQGVISQVEETVTGAYTLVQADRGKAKRYTGGAANWTVPNVGVGWVDIENEGSGTITFVASGTTLRPGSGNSIASGAGARLHLSNGGANYRVSLK
jgi:hypothetical protein